MTTEQEKLRQKFVSAIITLNIVTHFVGEKFDLEEDELAAKLVKDLATAREIFFEIYEDWRAHLGDPVEVKPSLIARELRQLADRLEEGDLDETD